MNAQLWLGMVGAAALSSAPGIAPSPLSEIHPLSINPGVNIVPGFTEDGRTATIVRGWRGNGNAHGYNVFLVLLPDADGRGHGVVKLEDTAADVVSDDPFDGERTLGAVRFARARLNGVPRTVLIVAHLDESPSGVLAGHATATIKVYTLAHSDSDVGLTADYFTLAWTTRTSARYCNVEPALAATLGIAPSLDYAGANAKDGCSRASPMTP